LVFHNFTYPVARGNEGLYLALISFEWRSLALKLGMVCKPHSHRLNRLYTLNLSCPHLAQLSKCVTVPTLQILGFSHPHHEAGNLNKKLPFNGSCSDLDSGNFIGETRCDSTDSSGQFPNWFDLSLVIGNW
jgi:hypothetical protein